WQRGQSAGGEALGALNPASEPLIRVVRARRSTAARAFPQNFRKTGSRLRAVFMHAEAPCVTNKPTGIPPKGDSRVAYLRTCDSGGVAHDCLRRWRRRGAARPL